MALRPFCHTAPPAQGRRAVALQTHYVPSAEDPGRGAYGRGTQDKAPWCGRTADPALTQKPASGPWLETQVRSTLSSTAPEGPALRVRVVAGKGLRGAVSPPPGPVSCVWKPPTHPPPFCPSPLPLAGLGQSTSRFALPAPLQRALLCLLGTSVPCLSLCPEPLSTLDLESPWSAGQVKVPWQLLRGHEETGDARVLPAHRRLLSCTTLHAPGTRVPETEGSGCVQGRAARHGALAVCGH